MGFEDLNALVSTRILYAISIGGSHAFTQPFSERIIWD